MVDECSKCILFISLFSALIFSQLWQSQDDDSSDELSDLDLSDLDLSDLDLSDFELSEPEESELEEVSEDDEEDVERMSSGCDFDIFLFFWKKKLRKFILDYINQMITLSVITQYSIIF